MAAERWGGGKIFMAAVSALALAGVGISLFGNARKRKRIGRSLAEVASDTLEIINDRSRGALRRTLGLPGRKELKRAFSSTAADLARVLVQSGPRWRLRVR